MGIVELILTTIIYISGAITEYESKGAVTRGIMYQDGNVSMVECGKIKHK